MVKPGLRIKSVRKLRPRPSRTPARSSTQLLSWGEPRDGGGGGGRHEGAGWEMLPVVQDQENLSASQTSWGASPNLLTSTTGHFCRGSEHLKS